MRSADCRLLVDKSYLPLLVSPLFSINLLSHNYYCISLARFPLPSFAGTNLSVIFWTFHFFYTKCSLEPRRGTNSAPGHPDGWYSLSLDQLRPPEKIPFATDLRLSCDNLARKGLYSIKKCDLGIKTRTSDR